MSRRRQLHDSSYDDAPEGMPGRPDQTPGAKGGAAGGIKLGQRWTSETEPELGLGTIVAVDHRRVTVQFHDGATQRIYSRENAPIRRVRFKPGDRIRMHDGVSITVREVRDVDGILEYETDTGTIAEPDLSGSIVLTAPLDRLLSGKSDSLALFQLRLRILALRNSIVQSPLKGFVGGRISLIPHQLYLANEISSRFVRRVMLADEVGLGKTIEACLILHRLIVSGRATQVLVVVPESLVHVWFVELLRKFNLLFKIFDRDYHDAYQTEGNQTNPFTEESLVLTSMQVLTDDPAFAASAAAVSWDMVIVDEAHHAREGTRPFEVIDELGRATKDLLLLTATPLQNGERSHFARLRMLDPSRYTDFDAFVAESQEHERLAAITARLLDGKEIDANDTELLRGMLAESPDAVGQYLQRIGDGSQDARRELVAELLDRRGIGRAMFRNTRAAIGGFPEREARIVPLDGERKQVDSVTRYFAEDTGNGAEPGKRKLAGDPRIQFLAEMLRSGDQKVLVICRAKETALAVDEALRLEISVNTALFHEELTLLQRDRNAAWFAEDEGARLLVCSEIGSEGRNFQFVHDLVMFDLPSDPELVEQRIGRLDRIGQQGPIRIHVPFINNTPDAVMAMWFDRGLGIFGSPIPAAQEVFDEVGDELRGILKMCVQGKPPAPKVLENLILRTQQLKARAEERLRAGRDRLLEQHSFRPTEAAAIIDQINAVDSDTGLRETMEELFRSKGVFVEEFNEHTWKLWTEGELDEVFPALRNTRPVVTFDRTTAIHREDMEFLSIDHPAIQGGIDLFLSSEKGNSSMAVWTGAPERVLLLDAVFVVECIAPPELMVDRFLPPAVIRVVVDHKMRERADLQKGMAAAGMSEAPALPVLEKPEVKQQLVPAMLRKALEKATIECQSAAAQAAVEVGRSVGGEVQRLESLSRINPAISQAEIALAQQEETRLKEAVGKAAPRLEALRLIWCPGPG